MRKYNSLITRNSPTAILYLVDSSGSMAEKIRFDGELIQKSEALCRIVNSAIHELICRCRSFDQHNNYFHLAVLSYSGNGIVNLLERYTNKDDFCTISDIATVELETKIYNYLRSKSDGTQFVTQRAIPQYISIEPCGITPMYGALSYSYKLLRKWILENKGRSSFPPIVINITDGETSDAIDDEMMIVSNKIKRLSTEDGNVLLFNIHLSSSQIEESIMFPSSINSLPDIRNIRMLYEMSSILPQIFHEEILNNCKSKTAQEVLAARAITCNTSMDSLIKALEVGSLSKNLIK